MRILGAVLRATKRSFTLYTKPLSALTKWNYILLIASITLFSCQEEERLFWVDSRTDYHVLIDVLNLDNKSNADIKLLTREEILSAVKHDIFEIQDIIQTDEYLMKAYYVTLASGELGSFMSLRTTNNNGKLIDALHFSNWPSTEDQPFCESTIFADLTIEKNCGNEIEYWTVTKKGHFEQKKASKRY